MTHKTLLDSSVWIAYFHRSNFLLETRVDDLLDMDQVCLCGIVEMELYAGLKKREEKIIKARFQVLPYLNCSRDIFISAGKFWQQFRRDGVTLPMADLLILSHANEYNCNLMSLDKHFSYFDKILPNRVCVL